MRALLISGFWLAAMLALVMAIIPQAPQVPGASDKFQHVLAFGALTLLARLAFPETRRVSIWLAMFAFGGLIELVQMVPILERDAEWADLIADAIAITATLVAFDLVAVVRGRPATDSVHSEVLSWLVVLIIVALPAAFVLAGMWLAGSLID